MEFHGDEEAQHSSLLKGAEDLPSRRSYPDSPFPAASELENGGLCSDDSASPTSNPPVSEMEPPVRGPWVSLFAGNRSRTNGTNLSFIAPEIIDGEDIVIFEESEALGLKYLPSRDSGVSIFEFGDAADKQKIFDEGPWFVDGKPIILKPWSKDVSLVKSATQSIPVWVRFPGLNLHMWNESTLSRIASSIGVPLFTDKLTADKSRLSFARVCIEVDAAKPLKTEVKIKIGEGKFLIQKVLYDWKPIRCSKCLSFGHSDSHCLSVSTWLPKSKSDQNPISEPFTDPPSPVRASTPPVSSPLNGKPKSPILVPIVPRARLRRSPTARCYAEEEEDQILSHYEDNSNIPPLGFPFDQQSLPPLITSRTNTLNPPSSHLGSIPNQFSILHDLYDDDLLEKNHVSPPSNLKNLVNHSVPITPVSSNSNNSVPLAPRTGTARAFRSKTIWSPLEHSARAELGAAGAVLGGLESEIFLDVPSDITIEVSGGTFPLHKFPLVSRSGRIRKLVAEYRDSDISRVELLSLPGGVEAFELAAKFCYGVNFEITSSNVAQLCCVSDYLEMTEEYAKENLASRAEAYLDSVVCKSLEMCVEVLQQCENLLPLADELKIVGRCTDAIASKACVEQIASSFSRLEYSSSGRLHMNRQGKCDGDWWIEDLSVLRIDLYQRVIAAMRCRGVHPESIGASLVNYAQKVLTKKPSLWNASTQPKADIVVGSIGNEQRLVVETIISLFPVEKLAVPISFLFGLLRTAVILDCSIARRLDLERRIGSQLDIATLDDLLIPSFRHAGDTLFDVDTVHRILVNFSQQDDSEDDMEDSSAYESDGPDSPSHSALLKVSKLVDNYLAEIAADANLKLTKFMVIAETLPSHARTIHDGLYRAIDIYLKAHQNLSDQDRKKLCKLIDFQKLSQEAGAHAAQNERLPLQSMVQVLYFEQLRLRNALNCSFPDEDHKPTHQSWRISSGALSAAMSPRDNYASLRRENRELKLELARLRMRLNDLEKDHVCMKKDMERSSSQNFMSSFSRKISKLNLFGHSSSRGSSSPSKQSQKTDSKMTERT
ncbi:hypothetical protein HHK36_013041 [Tetracentron sinense]|uniref:Uncharacterized protein n=1 Tax=Tetracentron sinense TaxID=13715 RepID=A0A834Z6Z1_TETSI|nr:hypothetical protein HHK36_013041 [Tetracentron sinense]